MKHTFMSGMMRKVVECETGAEEGRKTNKVEEGGGPNRAEREKGRSNVS